MELIIQLESVEYLVDRGFPNDKEAVEDILVTKEMLEDTYEDGSIIGYGYEEVFEMKDKEKEREIDLLLRKLEAFHCVVDFEKKTIVFTKEFRDMYSKLYFILYKEKISNSKFEEFLSYNYEKEIQEYEKSIPFANINVVSNSLHICKESILNLCRMNFNSYNERYNDKMNETPFKIVGVFVGH